MKGFLLVASGLLLVLASLGASAQEMSINKGGRDRSFADPAAGRAIFRSFRGFSTGGAFGRILGRTVGRLVAKATGDYSDAYEAREIVDGASQDIAAGAGNGGKTVAAYMATIRFDDGNESAIQSARADHLRAGGREPVGGIRSDTVDTPRSCSNPVCGNVSE